MGCWGTGLYSNDVARDLKADFKELARVPLEPEALVETVRGLYPASDEPSDEDHANFWLVLADLLHAYGIPHQGAKDRAIHLIDTGVDIEINRALDMSEPDLRKRAAVLEKLKAKLATPNPRPRDRRVFKAPPPLLMEEGDLWIYPTAEDNPVHRLTETKRADAWNAFVVAGADYKFGYYPYYFVVRLHVFARHRPTLEDCRHAPLGWQRAPFVAFDRQGNEIPGGTIVTKKAGGWVLCFRKSLKLLVAERLGRLPVDGDRLRPVYNDPDSRFVEICPPDLDPRRRYDGIIFMLLANNAGGLPDYRPVPADETLADYLLS